MAEQRRLRLKNQTEVSLCRMFPSAQTRHIISKESALFQTRKQICIFFLSEKLEDIIRCSLMQGNRSCSRSYQLTDGDRPQ